MRCELRVSALARKYYLAQGISCKILRLELEHCACKLSDLSNTDSPPQKRTNEFLFLVCGCSKVL